MKLLPPIIFVISVWALIYAIIVGSFGNALLIEFVMFATVLWVGSKKG